MLFFEVHQAIAQGGDGSLGAVGDAELAEDGAGEIAHGAFLVLSLFIINLDRVMPDYWLFLNVELGLSRRRFLIRSSRTQRARGTSLRSSEIDSLFCRFSVEVFVVLFRFSAGMVDNAVSMILRGIERIEF